MSSSYNFGSFTGAIASSQTVALGIGKYFADPNDVKSVEGIIKILIQSGILGQICSYVGSFSKDAKYAQFGHTIILLVSVMISNYVVERASELLMSKKPRFDELELKTVVFQTVTQLINESIKIN